MYTAGSTEPEAWRYWLIYSTTVHTHYKRIQYGLYLGAYMYMYTLTHMVCAIMPDSTKALLLWECGVELQGRVSVHLFLRLAAFLQPVMPKVY